MLRHWQHAPTSIELQVRRLRWWQSIATNPQPNGQFLAALFGDLAIEQESLGFVPTLDPSTGTLKSNATMVTYFLVGSKRSGPVLGLW